MALAPFIAAPEAATSSKSTEASVIPRPPPPYGFRDGDPNPAACCHRVVELRREAVLFVAGSPVLVVELRANMPNCFTYRLEVFLRLKFISKNGTANGRLPARSAPDE